MTVSTARRARGCQRATAYPYGPGERTPLLARAMDDGANVAAALWFVREVFAALRAADPALCLHLVGARPGACVRALAHRLQNNVLEAIAMLEMVFARPRRWS